MIFPDTLLLTLAALSAEALFSYPSWLFRLIGHPVTWIGRAIAFFEKRLNLATLSSDSLRGRGAMLLASLLLLTVLLAIMLDLALSASWVGFFVEALLASALLAQRSLYDHVQAVAQALDGPLEGAREKVGMIVGRNVAALDRDGVVRAAIESLAENFADGVVAPAFWMALAGLPGAVAYKTINTADSMIGHKTPRYLHFGRAAAKTDDAANWAPARLAGLLLVVAAAFCPGASARQAWRVMWRDAAFHASPNAGWPEAAMAGALGLRLGGPRSYGAHHMEAAYLGDGDRLADKAALNAALKLYRIALYGQFMGLTALTYLFL